MAYHVPITRSTALVQYGDRKLPILCSADSKWPCDGLDFASFTVHPQHQSSSISLAENSPPRPWSKFKLLLSFSAPHRDRRTIIRHDQ